MADGSQPPQNLLAQLASAYGGTAAVPAVQRSQYLADALQNMTRTGGQDLKSPLALGSNLLAEALLNWGRSRSNKALLDQVKAGQSDYMQGATMGIFGPQGGADIQPPASPPSGGPGGAAPAGAAPSPASFASPPPASPTPQASAPAVAGPSPADRDLLARLLIGEGGNMHADADVVGNRAKLAGMSVPDVIGARHQFEPFDNPRTWAKLQTIPTTSPKYQQALAIATDELTNGPQTNYDHFYGPAAQAALAKRDGRSVTPSWDNGTGTDIDGQRYFSLGYGGKPALPASAFAQGAPQQGAPMGPGGPAPMPRPMQVSTGPDPSVGNPGGQGPSGASPFGGGAPMAAPQGSPAPAPSPALPGGGAAPMQGPPTGPVATPQERQYLDWALHHPPGSIAYQQGVALAQEIQKRVQTPVALKPDEAYGSDGQARFIGPQSQTIANGPAGGQQRAPDGSISSFSNPNMGAIPGGTMAGYGAGGQPQITPVQGAGVQPMTPQQRQAYGIQDTDRSVYGIGPDQKPVKIADAPFTPKDVGERLTKLQGSDQFKLADNATNMYTAAVQAAQRSGGISDVELRDFAARQFSGGVARQFNVEALNNAQGAWANLKQFIPELVSGQHMSPPARQALLQAMHDDAIQAQTAFGHLAQSDESFVNSQGMTLKPFLAPLTRQLPPVPGLNVIPNGSQSAPQQQPADPIAAELQRRGYVMRNGQWTKP